MKEINLDHPVKLDGMEVSVLKMRRAKVRDVLAAKNIKAKSEEAERVLYYANLCEVPEATMADVDLSDWDKVMDAFDDLHPEQPTPEELQQGMMIIARSLNQPFSEMKDWTIDEFINWLVRLSAEKKRESAA
jgi:hypothetical protein